MKRIFGLAMMAIAAGASAETILVEPGEGHKYVGDKFDARTVKQTFFESRPCQLPIVNAEHMRQHINDAIAIPMKACWGRTLGGGIVMVFENGMSMSGSEQAYVAATVDKNGGATVIKSIYKKP